MESSSANAEINLASDGARGPDEPDVLKGEIEEQLLGIADAGADGCARMVVVATK